MGAGAPAFVELQLAAFRLIMHFELFQWIQYLRCDTIWTCDGSMENRPKLYASAAFVAGILLTLGFKDFYPDLEFRFWKRRNANKTLAGAGLGSDDRINLEDHDKDGGTVGNVIDLPEGIEACIGNTPLFKIKSLSRETGCEILAKAEVIYRCFFAKQIDF